MLQKNRQGKEKIWLCQNVADEEVEKISKEADISYFLAKILAGRGMNDVSQIKKFLTASLSDLHDPFAIKDMGKAVDRIIGAIKNSEKVVIYGDYDVDGITSTSVLINFLSGCFNNVEYYIPDRIDEGYGLSMGAIDKIRQSGAELIITVDCGITAIDEVKYINNYGIDVIITDHHECKEILPEAYAVVSPCRPDSDYPFQELAGVGVVYKLVTALCMKMGLGDIYNKYLDLVALGTIADVVPLEDENRIIAKYGIAAIEKTSNLGLRTLLEQCGLKDKAMSSWSISFVIAPRINAAGRVGHAGKAVELLTTFDKGRAVDIVEQLGEANRFRQETEMEILQQVIAKIEEEIDLDTEKVIVVSGEEWHHGVIGIVASKITERYYKPCILISHEEGVGKGSGRSVEGFDLFKALSYCGDLLEKYGGHELAAGLSLKMDNIMQFRRKINAYADEVMEEESLIPRLKIDVNINKEDINMSNIRELELLAPFGAANPAPVFEYDGLRINDIRTVGENKHLKLVLEDNGFYMDAIAFGMGSLSVEYERSDLLDVACALEINSWNSSEKVQLNLKDIRSNHDMAVEENFFYSLDKCIKFNSIMSLKEGCKPFNCNFSMLTDKTGIFYDLHKAADNGEKVVILVNSLSGAKAIEKKLKKSSRGIKKTYSICYTNFNCIDDENRIIVVINPDPDQIELAVFDRIILYGEWINWQNLYNLTCKIDPGRIYYIKCDMDVLFDISDIVPDRKDLVSVYQYIKANCRNGMLSDNIFKLSKKISSSYKTRMNYFKVKKSLEIFEELNLIRKEPASDGSVVISILDNGKEKTNIERSLLYRNLQALKSDYLKNTM